MWKDVINVKKKQKKWWKGKGGRGRRRGRKEGREEGWEKKTYFLFMQPGISLCRRWEEKEIKWTSPRIDAFHVEKDVRYKKTRHKDGVRERKWLERESSISPLWTSEISVITCGSTCIISFGLTRVSGQIWGFPFRSRGDLDTTRLHVLPEDSSCPWTGISANYSEGEFDLSLYQPSGWKWHKNFPCLTPMHLLISKCRKRQIVLITRPWAGYINHPSQQRLLTQCGLLKFRNSQTTYNNVYLVT